MSDTQAGKERRHYLRRNADTMQDEISLIDLYRVLVNGKKILLATMATIIVLAVVYLILTPKVYQVTARLLEPTADKLVLTINAVSDPARYVPKDIFEKYMIELKKNETWNLFINANSDFSPDGSNEGVSNPSVDNPLVITKDKAYPGPHILLKYDTNDKEKSDQVISQYLGFARNLLIQQLIILHKQEVEQKVAELKSKIKTSRVQEKIKREDNIVRLKNDLDIANKLNIKENRMMTLQSKTSLTVVASNMNIPRYMRGTRVLEAELEALQNRSTDDAFIKGLRDWQQEVNRLKLIKYTPEQFQPFILDGAINEPKSPIKPKKKLVLVLSAILGLFLGIFAVFFFEFTKKATQLDR